jgi:hypothetical protein
MLKFCCNLPNCNRRFATDRGLYQHKKQDPRHNRNKSYDSYNKVGKKRHFPIQYECNQNTESNLSKKSSTEPRYRINAGDVMSDIVEEDKNSYEDLEEITAENFDEVSRNDDDLFLPVGDNDGRNNISEDDERKI